MLVRVALAGVLLLAAFVYLGALDRAPIYVGWDEARFALQGQSIAATGRDLNGHVLPLFFHNTDPLIRNNSSSIWWQPVLIYLIALVLRIAPFAERSVRLPIAGLAVLDVWLAYAIARRLFANPWYAVLAALMLALAPAHVIMGRMASDYFCPVPFALLWLWCVVRARDTDSLWLCAATGLVLGVGLYSYIAAWIIMPFYLALTHVVFWLYRKPLRAHAALLGAFVLPFAVFVPWVWFHPNVPRDIFLGYQVKTAPNVAQRVSLYWDYFNPSYLFFSGGSELMWATRRAGVFLLATAALLPLGIWHIWRHRSIPHTLLLAGFFFAPVPIVLALPEAPEYATARDLLVVPYGVLLSVAGAEWLVARRGRFGPAAAAALILSIPIQFAGFARDYFTGYQARSAFRMDSVNMADAATFVMGSDQAARVPAVYLSRDLGTGKSVQWKFHLVKHHRGDLWERSDYFDADARNASALPPGSLLIVPINHPRMSDLTASSRCTIVHVVRGAANEPTAAILRRN